MSPDIAVAEVRRHLPATPAKVFSAFANAALVSRWLTPSPEIKLSVLEFDFCVGGRYRFAYHVPDAQTMYVGGTYQSIEPPSKIVFSWNVEPPDEHAGLQSVVIVSIVPAGDGSELDIRHERLTQAGSVERHSAGWRGAVDQLGTLLCDLGLSHGG